MALIKKNVWSLFYLIFSLSLLTLSTIIYSIYKDIHEEYQLEQENIVQMTANSTTSILLQYEMMLNILGKQLIKDANYKSVNNSRILLDELMQINPSILGLSLVKPNGQEYITNSNVNIKDMPNLLQKKETRDSFKYTLKHKKMIIGRTYFVKQLNKFIIPLRKTIRNKHNEVLAVMTAGIDLQKGFDFFIKNKKNDLIHETFIFRNYDYYFQIAQKIHSKNLKIYNYAIPKELIEKSIDMVTQKYKMSIDEIRNKKMITTVENYHGQRKVLASSIYLKEHDLWITSQIPLNLIHDKIYQKAIIFILIFIGVMSVIFILFRNINNHEKRKQESLYYQATHDYLTNLHNRLYLSKEFINKNPHNEFSMLFIDMDNFKKINDNYGHMYGDRVLIEISNRLKHIKEDDDTLVRYSGDEFILLTPCIIDKKIENLSSLILETLSKPYIINQYKFILGASIGIAQFPQDGKEFDEVKRYADIAMYEAKKTKNSYCIINKSMKETFFNTSIIEEEVLTSLDNNEIYMMYQPQINKDGTLYGVEALVRWENKKLGFIPPDKFISIAENIGFMNKLGKFIIEQSLNEIQSVKTESGKDFQLSINISVKQFVEMDFYESILESIKNYNFNNISLTLEVTENIFIEDVNVITSLLLKLKEHGIKVSLDDFGTGYSSLSLLKELPIDELKIDKSFVDDLETDSNAKAMAENIIAIGKKLNMYILAEGVETIEQKELLESFGCDLFQGYYYSKPLKIEHLKKYIEQS